MHKGEWQKMLMAEKLLVDKVNESLEELNRGIEDDDGGPKVEIGWLGAIAKDMAAQSHLMLGMQWKLAQLEWEWEAAKVMHGADVTFDDMDASLPKDSGV